MSGKKYKPIHVFVWTDGSAVPNPGNGGWASILIWEDSALVLTGYQEEATNNEMEALAVLRALQRITKPCLVTVCSDSQYVGNGIRAVSEGRVFEKNNHIWSQVLAEYKRHLAVRVEHITAHRADTHVLSKLCDNLAHRISQKKGKKIPEERYASTFDILQEAEKVRDR